MKIYFNTSIDHYKTNCFPENLTYVPRIGEKVMVTEIFTQYYIGKKLPVRLEVVDVSHTDKGIVCELYYSKTDKLKSNIK